MMRTPQPGDWGQINLSDGAEYPNAGSLEANNTLSNLAGANVYVEW
jgi:hypothetical protein